jgi:hypothetical protein
MFLVVNRFVIKLQLKDLTHTIGPWTSSHKLHKWGVFFFVLILKYVYQFAMSSNNFNFKGKT